jgi:predicted DNA-binding protein
MTQTSGPFRNRHDTLASVTGRSGRGTARQTIRLDEDLWERFDEATKRLGTDRSSWIRDAVRWCVGETDVSPPEQPSERVEESG